MYKLSVKENINSYYTDICFKTSCMLFRKNKIVRPLPEMPGPLWG